MRLIVFLDEICPWPSIGNEIFETRPSTDQQALIGGSASVVDVDILDPKLVEMVRGWTARCEVEHPYCRPDFQVEGRDSLAHILPKRLIYVGGDDELIQIRETRRNAFPYVALSYCWGRTIGVRLTKANSQQLSSSVSAKDLLPVHRDAITITRKLGVQYLWVDALCIIQDDVDDKNDEIANMASIYSNAYLTIAVTGSDDAANSIFTSRNPTHEISMTEIHGHTSSIWVRQKLDHEAFEWGFHDFASPATRNTSGWQSLQKHYPLFTRGWCFQERLLSRRILHFTRDEVIWECLGGISCECGTLREFAWNLVLAERRYAAGLPLDIEIRCGKVARAREAATRLRTRGIGYISGGTTVLQRDDPAYIAEVLGSHDPSSWEEGHTESWRDLVSQYSRRNLTMATDALPAIAGLATITAHHQLEPSDYIAGMWRKDLLHELLWFCVDSRTIARPQDYVAPSWSWASVRRAVDWLPARHGFESHVTIVEALSELSVLSSPFGQVKSGHMRVRGSLVRCTLKINEDNRDTDRAWAKNDTASASFIADCVPEIQALAGSRVCCLWWSTDINDRRTNRGFERALVLAPVVGSDLKAFRRIGMMQHFPRYAWEGQGEEHEIVLY